MTVENAKSQIDWRFLYLLTISIYIIVCFMSINDANPIILEIINKPPDNITIQSEESTNIINNNIQKGNIDKFLKLNNYKNHNIIDADDCAVLILAIITLIISGIVTRVPLIILSYTQLYQNMIDLINSDKCSKMDIKELKIEDSLSIFKDDFEKWSPLVRAINYVCFSAIFLTAIYWICILIKPFVIKDFLAPLSFSYFIMGLIFITGSFFTFFLCRLARVSQPVRTFVNLATSIALREIKKKK